MSISGSLAQLVINNQDYPVANDADVSRTFGKWEKEAQATSGDPNIKHTLRVEMAEGFDVQLDGTEREVLRDVIDSTGSFDVLYKTVAGDAYTCKGSVFATGDVTQDSKITLTIFPVKRTGWTAITV